MFGKRLRELRKEKKLTQKDLASLLKKSDSAIRMWELDKSERIMMFVFPCRLFWCISRLFTRSHRI